MPRISIVIPVYNEAATIREIIRRVQTTPYEKEIIVVDDGSTDGTREILQGIGEANVRVVIQPRNQGKGAAVRTGLSLVTGDFVILQDADLEYDPRDYAALLDPLINGDADVVYGSRFLGTPRRVLFFWHTLANQLLTVLSNMLTDLNLTDMETGYKAFRVEVVRRLHINSNRFGIEPEITAKIARLGCRVYEVPISYRGRTYREGKKIRWTDGVSAIGSILRYSLFGGPASSHAGLATLSAVDGLRNYNAWLWKHIQPHVGRRVFEAGSGTGAFTKNLIGQERVITTDFDQHYVDVLANEYRSYPNVSVHWSDLSSKDWVDLANESIDTILCTNVLEHLPDDRYVLGRFKQILERDGKLILLVPAHQALFGQIDKEIGHYRRYNVDALRRLLRDCGFDVLQIGYLNPTGVLGWFLNARILKRTAVPERQARMYDAIFPLLSRAQNLSLPFGLSVLAVARNPGTRNAAPATASSTASAVVV